MAAVAVNDEVGLDREFVTASLGDAHVADEAPRARVRKLGVGVAVLQAQYALADASGVVGDHEQGRAGCGVGCIVRRHAVSRVGGQERQPGVELPGVQQGGFFEEKILDLRTRDVGGRHAVWPMSAPISSAQRIQNARRCSSSVLSCSPSLAMPRDITDHGTSR